jgi:K+-transporting ATPase ATPase A chain
VTGQGLLQLALYLVVLVLLVKPLGAYMADVFQGERTFMSPVVGPIERLIYRVAGVDQASESDWKRYAFMQGCADRLVARTPCLHCRSAGRRSI